MSTTSSGTGLRPGSIFTRVTVLGLALALVASLLTIPSTGVDSIDEAVGVSVADAAIRLPSTTEWEAITCSAKLYAGGNSIKAGRIARTLAHLKKLKKLGWKSAAAASIMQLDDLLIADCRNTAKRAYKQQKRVWTDIARRATANTKFTKPRDCGSSSWSHQRVTGKRGC